MADRDHNQLNLEAFNQELCEAIAPRSKRRSSILKAVDNNLPEDRRQSRRISFHTNILCQQILPDGTTHVVTEALKAKLPDSSASTVSDESRPSLPEKCDEENLSRKRVTTSSSSSASGVKRKKDPKIVAQSYQNFIKRTYDAENENDYDTVFNTSVNRNGFQIAPRDQRLDVTKLFAVDQTEGNMDITKALSSANESHVQNENDVSAAQTKVFSDMSMSLEESMNEVANVSEMDTAMIIDDDVFDDSDEKKPDHQSIASPVKQDIVTAPDTASPNVSSNGQVADVSDPAVIIMDQESIADVSMSIVSEGEIVASQEPVEKTKVFEDCGMEVTGLVPAKTSDEGNKTQVFSQGDSISIEKNLSKGISPASSQEPSLQPTSSQQFRSHQNRDDDIFHDKSASFKNNKALTLAFSRVSFPRNLDKVLKQRREQMDRTYQALKNADISSDIDSYSDSPRQSLHNESSACSVRVPDATSVLFEKSSIHPQNEDASTAKDESVSAERVVNQIERLECQNVTQARSGSDRHISSAESVSSGFLAPSSGTLSSQESDHPSEQLHAPSSKRSSDSHFLSTSMGLTSSDESGSESGDTSCFDETMDAERDGKDDDENDSDLHEDRLFEMFHGTESSFIISPDSSFHSSFVCQDDTLLVLGDDIDAKLNQFLQCCDSDADATAAAIEEDRDLTFVPLRSFPAHKHGVTLLTENPDQLVAFLMFGTMKLTVDLGSTLRSFNGIPIKVLKRIGIESVMKDADFVVQDDGISLVDFSDDKMKGLIAIAQEMLMSGFDEQKVSIISKYPTSDQLTDVLHDISELVNESKRFLNELALTSLLHPMQVYRKNGKVYDLAFQLPGRRRNFFLILAIDPASYPFVPLKVRFGFDRADLPLYHVNNFAKALSLVVKPGKHYVTRMIDAAKKYVLISRKISQSKN